MRGTKGGRAAWWMAAMACGLAATAAEPPAPLAGGAHRELRLAGAEKILAAAQAHAVTLGVKVNIAVVDAGGHPLAFVRMDGARPGSAYTAQYKAQAAALMRQPTGPLPPGVKEPDLLLNLSIQNTANAGGGKVTSLYGGVPIQLDGEVVGAVGVGGASGEQDAECAKAGIAALMSALAAEPAPQPKPDLPK